MAAAVLLAGRGAPWTGRFEALYRVNIGGKAYTDRAGTVWRGEQLYKPGSWGVWHEGFCETFDTDAPIAKTDDDPLYQTIRYGQDVRLKFDSVPNGDYVVRLHFADILSTDAAEPAAMRIEIEDKVVLPELNLLRVAKTNCALARDFQITVADGQLNVDLINLSEPAQEGAKLAAVEVLRAGP